MGGGMEGGKGGRGQQADLSGPGPHAASLLGNVGRTTVSGTVTGSEFGGSQTLPVGEDIYGPFEAGFGAQQANVLARLGCKTTVNVPGGIDTHTAEQMVAAQCGVKLPRYENGQLLSLLDTCGGHTREYHFHERLKCLYQETGAHSTQIGLMNDDQPLYGKWENFQTGALPKLDSCGGHYGPTPQDPSGQTYHYHVQDQAPFTVGCYGPNADGSLVSLEQCRALYEGCNDGSPSSIETAHRGTISYDLWCPCYDKSGSNVEGQRFVSATTNEVSVNAEISVASGVETTEQPTKQKKNKNKKKANGNKKGTKRKNKNRKKKNNKKANQGE